MKSFTVQEKAFFKLLQDIKTYLSYFVLVGGWVPYVYRNFLWKEDVPNPCMTTDIDLGFSSAISDFPKQPIYNQFIKHNYPERHLKMDRLFPVVPLVKIEGQGVSIPVEFLTTVNPSEEAIEKLIGKQIYFNALEKFEIILENPLPVKIYFGKNNFVLKIPPEEKFVFHKMLIFSYRKDNVKKGKDLYYAYYVLKYVPDREVLLENISKLKNTDDVKIVARNLKKYFKNTQSEGVLLIEREIGINTYNEDIREDIYQKFNNLKECF